MSFKEVKVTDLSNAQKGKIGELVVLFSYIEWLIANVVLLLHIPPQDYEHVGEMDLANDYFKTLLALNFSRKIDNLRSLGFDVSNLRKIGEYRNNIVHGIMFDDGEGLISNNFAKGKNVNFSNEIIDENIKLLQEEGAKLLNFLENRGYKPQ